MRPIVINVPTRSSTVKKIVELLAAEGAEAYYQAPDRRLRNPLVIHWGYGGNKYTELARLGQAGVLVPRYSRSPVANWIPRRANHAEAVDFTDPPRLPDFWTEPTFTNHEFRVHVLKDSTKDDLGYAFRTQYKYLPEGQEALVRYGIPVRNHSLGWKFDPRPEARFPETMLARVRAAALAAIQALDYNMGAADVGLIVGSNGLIPDKPVIFEVNTRPSMDEYTQGAYVKALLRLASG